MWGPSDRGALSGRRVRIGLTEKATLNSYLKYSRSTDPRKERHKACRRVSTCKGLRSELAHVFKSFKKANMTGAQREAEGARQKKVGEVVSTTPSLNHWRDVVFYLIQIENYRKVCNEEITLKRLGQRD